MCLKRMIVLPIMMNVVITIVLSNLSVGFSDCVLLLVSLAAFYSWILYLTAFHS